MGHGFPAFDGLQSFFDQVIQRGVLQCHVGIETLQLAVLVRQISVTGRPASASLRIDTICVSLNFDWRMGTSWLIAIVPESSLFGPSQIRGSVREQQQDFWFHISWSQ